MKYIAFELSGNGKWYRYESEFEVKETAKSISIIPLTPSHNDYIFEKTILRKDKNNNRIAISEISEILIVLYRKDVGSPIKFIPKK